MEIPIINRITNFEPSLTSLQNPSFLSQILSLSGAEKVFQAYTFWKWSALIIAIVASFGTIICKIKFFIIRLQNRANSITSEAFLKTLEDSDDDTVSCSSYSSSSESEDAGPNSPSSSQSADWPFNNEYFVVKGSSGHYFDDQWQNRNSSLRRRLNSSDSHRFSWSDFTSGNSVVKLWDSLGLRLDQHEESERIVSSYDMEKEKNIKPILIGKWCVPSMADLSPSAIFFGETSNSRKMSLGVLDERMCSSSPAILTKWCPQKGTIVGVDTDGTKKVVVRDDVLGGLTVGDLRKASSPLKNVMEAERDETWWDTDTTVIVSNQYVDESGTTRRDSAITRLL